MCSLLAQSDWVVWDTSILTFVQSHIGKAAGAAVGVGILMLAVILGIRVAVKIVNHFIK